jgi:UDP-N-acetylglucosamine 2-epimerase (non-hydrolysing)
VGNVMIDSLLRHRDAALARPLLGTLGLRAREYGVVTLHRPANVDDDAVLASLLDVLGRVASLGLPLLLPVHPRARAAIDRVGPPPGVRLLDPLGYLDFVCLEAGAAVVLTDSGGVQEETTVLGVPCVTLRDSTERPITVTQGTNVVVGHDAGRVLAAVEAAMAGGATPHRPDLWDGAAAPRVIDVLAHCAARLAPEPPAATDDPA